MSIRYLHLLTNMPLIQLVLFHFTGGYLTGIGNVDNLLMLSIVSSLCL